MVPEATDIVWVLLEAWGSELTIAWAILSASDFLIEEISHTYITLEFSLILVLDDYWRVVFQGHLSPRRLARREEGATSSSEGQGESEAVRQP